MVQEEKVLDLRGVQVVEVEVPFFLQDTTCQWAHQK